MVPQAWTFASPKVGDAAFAARYGALSTVSWRIYNQVDVVPYFPVDIFDTYQPVTTGGRRICPLHEVRLPGRRFLGTGITASRSSLMIRQGNPAQNRPVIAMMKYAETTSGLPQGAGQVLRWRSWRGPRTGMRHSSRTGC